jgi:hypothetical protein
LRVDIARFNVFYVGLAFASLYIVGLPVVAGLCPCPPCSGAGLSGLLTVSLLVAATLGAILVHEYTHYLAARLAGVEGARIRASLRMAALMLEYDYMSPREYVIVTLAPQILTAVYLALAGLTCGSPLTLAFCVAGLINLGGGIPDIVNSIYFGVVHHGAKSFRLLYDEDGRVAGGVVEYNDRIVVYPLRTRY